MELLRLCDEHSGTPVSSHATALRYPFFKKANESAQHGVKALDGGDADAADRVELRGLIDSLPRIDPSGFPSVSHRFPLAPLQVLDVVKLGELAASSGEEGSSNAEVRFSNALIIVSSGSLSR